MSIIDTIVNKFAFHVDHPEKVIYVDRAQFAALLPEHSAQIDPETSEEAVRGGLVGYITDEQAERWLLRTTPPKKSDAEFRAEFEPPTTDKCMI